MVYSLTGPSGSVSMIVGSDSSAASISVSALISAGSYVGSAGTSSTSSGF